MTTSQYDPRAAEPAQRWILFFLLTLILALIALNGCGGTHNNSMMQAPMAQPISFAFVSNTGSGTVSAFAMSNSGALSQVSGSPFPSGAGAEFMAFDNLHKFLFVTNQSSNNISAFAVNTSSGMLARVSGSPFATGATPLGVAVDSMGRFLFVANQDSNSVSVFSINSSSGALAQVPGSPFSGVSNPFGVTVSPNGAFLFVSSANATVGTGNTISAFAIDSTTGSLTQMGSPAATSNPVGITSPIGMATDGKFLFVGDHMAEAVVPFSINALSGSLTPVSALPAPGSSCTSSCHHNPLRLTVDPMDKFVFWTNVQAGTLSAFNINNGALTAIAETPTGQHPFGLALDPSGTLLYVVNKVDNSISGFSVNPNTGTVTPLSGSPFPEGNNAPTDIVIVARQ
ncbi:MAG TPA: beta-propeller fold lactonase family protein [Terriglobales bacterium]|nr:beta-propeller fold lactonase family protein [Terriglobales bacterium]